jgi:hypothetical protein
MAPDESWFDALLATLCFVLCVALIIGTVVMVKP